MFELKERIKKYFGFSKDEIKSLTIVILLIGFIVGFNDGRENNVIDTFYAFNMLSSILIVALTVLVHISAQRIVGLQAGFKTQFKVWWYGIAFGLIASFISKGNVWILLPGGIFVLMLEKHRLGKFRYGLNYWPIGLTSFTGPLANILLALFFRVLSNIDVLSSNVLLEKAILVNVAYALYTYLPIPPLDGFALFYASRLTFVFTYGTLLGAAIILVLNVSLLLTIIGALLIGGLIWGTYYWKFEREAW